MNKKILHILNAMVSNLELLNSELMRLYRSEQFSPDPVCYELIKRTRIACMGTLDNVTTLEKLLDGQTINKSAGPANNNDTPQS